MHEVIKKSLELVKVGEDSEITQYVHTVNAIKLETNFKKYKFLFEALFVVGRGKIDLKLLVLQIQECQVTSRNKYPV